METINITVAVDMYEPVGSTFEYNYNKNLLVEVGDWVYYTPTSNVGGIGDIMTEANYITVGKIRHVSAGPYISGFAANGSVIHDASKMQVSLNVEVENPPINPPSANDFVFFSKNSTANINSIVGYFAKTRFINDSKDKAELFMASCQYFESSK